MSESPSWRIAAPVCALTENNRLRGHLSGLVGEWAIMLDPVAAAVATARRLVEHERWAVIGTVAPSAAEVRLLRELAQRADLAELLGVSQERLLTKVVEERRGAYFVREQALPLLVGFAVMTPMVCATTALGARLRAGRPLPGGVGSRQSASDAGEPAPDAEPRAPAERPSSAGEAVVAAGPIGGSDLEVLEGAPPALVPGEGVVTPAGVHAGMAQGVGDSVQGEPVVEP